MPFHRFVPRQADGLAELCGHCGVGVRTLEYGFRQFYDATPIGFIKSQRLTRARTALARAGGQPTSISATARRTGFTHMGQYAQDYRSLFGESPTMTLRRAQERDQPPTRIPGRPGVGTCNPERRDISRTAPRHACSEIRRLRRGALRLRL